jgi:phosphoribosylformylglycinamidine (FGAM) synthase-like amidotransferase family enzyme
MNGTTHAIEDIFPPTPLQMGMLYHAERSPNARSTYSNTAFTAEAAWIRLFAARPGRP